MPGKKNNGNEGVVARFHFLWAATLAGGTSSLQVSPSGLASLSTRMAAMADEYAHFAVRALRFCLHPSGTGTQTAGFAGGVQDTPPTSNIQITELLPSVVRGTAETVPTRWVEVPKQDLRGPFPWYKSLNGGADTTEEAPGTLNLGSTIATDTMIVEVFIDVAFKTAVAPANTPVEIAARKQLRDARLKRLVAQERAVITRILTGPSDGDITMALGCLRP